jgi:hypothetical protein
MSSLWYHPLHLSWSFGHDDLHSTINKVSLIRTISYSTQFSIFVQVSVGGKFMPMKKSLFDPRVPVQVLLLPPLLCRPIDMTAEE